MRASTILGALAAALLCAATAAVPASAGEKSRGEYLAAIMDCSGCHTEGAMAGKPDPDRHLGGSRLGFQIPGLGIFYPPNLTPDPETGLGRWTEDDIVKAVRTGVRPDGRVLAPAMPYHAYGNLTDEDARALAGYLKGIRPVSHRVPAIVGPGQQASAPYLGVVMPD